MLETTRRRILLSACLCLCILAGCQSKAASDPDAKESDPATLKVTLPAIVLDGVPVDSVVFEALNPDGSVLSTSRQVELEGLTVVTTINGEATPAEPVSIQLKNGRAELKTELAAGKRIYIRDNFAATFDNGTTTGGTPVMVAGFWSLLPPLIAILFAILLKDVYIALLAAVYSGALVLAGWDPMLAFTNMMNPDSKGFIAQACDTWNMQVIAFTLFLGAMVQLMADSGGTRTFVNRLSGLTSTRERGQLLTWFMGLLVFFDDYANTMLVGGAMRPVTDRLKISREKLAFLIDSTAAPIAGLAIVSTWVGVEVSYIGDGFDSLGMDKGISYSIFLKTLPYRFYPLFLIGFVMMIAASGRDFGPMLAAERRALAEPTKADDDQMAAQQSDSSMWLAIIPVLVLVGWILIGFAMQFEKSDAGRWQLSSDFDSVPLLLHGGFMAAFAACVASFIGGALNLQQCAESWVKGMKEMFPAIIVLILAWTVSSICKPGGLNTAGYLIEQIGDGVAPELMPTLAFVVSGAVAFAIGSSYTTMGLLIPLFMSLVGYMLFVQNGEAPSPDDALLLSTIGAILAGSIFGDHCSPISDTTVLSSAGAKCNHLRHVATQMPYALTVGTIAIVFGYLPAGYGVSPWLMLLVGFAVCLIVVFAVGRKAQSAPVAANKQA